MQSENDPYAVVTFGSRSDWKPRTETIWEGGANVQWDINASCDKWRIELAKEELKCELLRVVIMDANRASSDKLIGYGDISLANVAEAGIGASPTTIEIELIKDGSDDIRGYASVTVVLDRPVPTRIVKGPPKMTSQLKRVIQSMHITDEASETSKRLSARPLDPLKMFYSAVMCVRYVEVTQLKNVEILMGDANDPFVSLSFCSDKWESGVKPRTTTLWEAGSTAMWDILDITDKHWRISVTREELLSQSLKVVVKDANHVLRNKLIGVTELSLAPLAESGVSVEGVEVEGYLYSSPKRKRKTGYVRLLLLLLPPQSPVHTQVKGNPHFDRAVLSIKSISTRELVNVEWVLSPGGGRRRLSGETPKEDVYAESKVLLRESLEDEKRNRWLTVLLVTCLAGCVLMPIVHLVLSYRGTSVSDSTETQIIRNIILYACTLLSLYLLFFYGHRIFAYTAGAILRDQLSKKAAKDAGAYNIHIGWLSIRGFVDLHEVVLHNIIFRNHPSFTISPFIAHCKNLQVSLNLWDLYPLIVHGDPLRFNRVILENFEVYFERSDDPSAKYAQNTFAGIGVTDARGAVKAMITVIADKIKEKMDPLHVSMPKREIRRDVVTGRVLEFTMEVRRLIVLDVLAHPLDILSKRHMEPTKGTDIKLTEIIMHHKELTKEPLLPGEDRQPVTGDEFGDLIGAKIAQVLFAENPTRIVTLLSKTSTSMTSIRK